jgi:CARDB
MRAARLLPTAALVAALGCSADSPGTQPDPTEPQIDLAADALVGPAEAVVGGIVEYDVGLRNRGGERADAGWYVRVYLSEDALLGAEDILIDQFAARRALNPGAADSYPRSFKVPGTVEPGEYHLVSELDATGVIDEPIEDNNSGASEGRTRIEASDTSL